MEQNVTSQKEIWITFVGVLDLPIARSFVEYITKAIQNQVETVHLLIQSPGGNATEGVFLYNFIKCLPINVITYNSGFVGSAAVLAYLAGKKRIVCPTGTFLIHRAKSGPGHIATSDHMHSVAESLAIDDARAQTIFDDNIQLTEEQKKVFSNADLVLTANDSIKAKFAHEIDYFKPSGLIFSI